MNSRVNRSYEEYLTDKEIEKANPNAATVHSRICNCHTCIHGTPMPDVDMMVSKPKTVRPPRKLPDSLRHLTLGQGPPWPRKFEP